MENDTENNDLAPVKIAIRERPYLKKPPSSTQVIEENDEKIYLEYSPHQKVLFIEGRPFYFDNYIGPDVDQEELYKDLIRPMVGKVLEGFDCTAFAYGQTGTGKTYTMGLHADAGYEGKHAGMISRTLDDLFLLSANEDEDTEVFISVSFIEIYNEKVYDMLSPTYSEPVNVKGCKFPGGTRRQINAAEDAKLILQEGNKNRHVRSTKINPFSSRSHAIFTIHVRVSKLEGSTYSAFNLVDLAGSEGVKRTGHQGLAMAEGVHINQGLLCVSKVLKALSSGNKVIPYRDSVLSTVLQSSLNANSYLCLLACISPLKEDLNETLSTLRFAQDARTLKNQPQINAMLIELKRRNKTPSKYAPQLRSKNGETPNNNKRPFPNIMSTIKRPAGSGVVMHSNTFSTPNKIRKIENRPNMTDQFLQPPEFNLGEFSDFDLPVSRTSSNWNLNCSTSTEVDGLQTFERNLNDQETPEIVDQRNVDNYGNMEEMYKNVNTIMERFQNFMTTFEHNMTVANQSILANKTAFTQNNMLMSTVINGKENDANGVETRNCHNCSKHDWETIKKDIPSLIRKEVMDLQNTFLEKTLKSHVPSRLRDQSTSIDENMFKVPAPLSQQADTTRNDITVLHAEDYYNRTTNYNDTMIPMSNRSQVDLNNTTEQTFDETGSIAERQPNNCSTIYESMSESIRPLNTMNITSRRRSTRLLSRTGGLESEDVVTEHPTHGSPQKLMRVRRSTRLSTNPYASRMDEGRPLILMPKKNRGAAPTQVKVIAKYFTGETSTAQKKRNNTKEFKQNNLSKHRNAVLKLLNTGGIKEIQILPQIGAKTAYQIVTSRILNGPFRNFEALYNVPVWKGQKWIRFLTANNLQ